MSYQDTRYHIWLSGFVVLTTVRYHIGLSVYLSISLRTIEVFSISSSTSIHTMKWDLWPAFLRRLVFNMFCIDSTCTKYTVLSNSLKHHLNWLRHTDGCVRIYYTPPANCCPFVVSIEITLNVYVRIWLCATFKVTSIVSFACSTCTILDMCL